MHIARFVGLENYHHNGKWSNWSDVWVENEFAYNYIKLHIMIGFRTLFNVIWKWLKRFRQLVTINNRSKSINAIIHSPCRKVQRLFVLSSTDYKTLTQFEFQRFIDWLWLMLNGGIHAYHFQDPLINEFVEKRTWTGPEWYDGINEIAIQPNNSSHLYMRCRLIMLD